MMLVLAEVREYADLVEAIARRRKELGLSQLELDEIVGLASGHVSKLEAAPGARRPGTTGRPNFRCLGPATLGPLLTALGLRVQLVEDPTVRPRVPARLASHAVRHIAPREAA